MILSSPDGVAWLELAQPIGSDPDLGLCFEAR